MSQFLQFRNPHSAFRNRHGCLTEKSGAGYHAVSVAFHFASKHARLRGGDILTPSGAR
jgi:hypothetical protein